jgi:catechol 2,3-dioxygenase-like lactoylglutathione lyase family enzyme
MSPAARGGPFCMTHITQVATVLVPVSDQDRALAFYVETLGFEQRADFEYADGERWVEVAPPGAATQVTLVRARDGRPAGIETGVSFSTADVEADHAELRARGADVDEAILRTGDPVVHWAGAVLAGIPAMFLVRDPDGNSVLIVQGIT